MTVIRFIPWIAIVTILLIVLPTSLSLKGDINAICRRTISRVQSRYVPYTEPYKQQVWGISYRIRTRTNFKLEYHTVYTTEAVCCAGYQNIDDNCEPICSTPCTNGKCAKPDICECDRGYTQDFFGQKCDPVCSTLCVSGQCTAPETCTCDEGYELNENNTYICDPKCSSKCLNGFCAAPNICGCKSGYQINDNNECEPFCERPCINGKCIAPDVCDCNEGFQKSQDDDFECEPKCSQPCVFGACTTPEVCTCNSGYSMIPGSNFNCTPVCNETCAYGTCVAPDICSCLDGYALTPDSLYTCIPVCEEGCIRGKCVAPNLCECLEGHVEEPATKVSGSNCIPWCNGTCTNGECTAPQNCTCNSGYRYNKDTTDCDPIITATWINGICETDQESCRCLDGYKQMTVNSTTCVPVCENCVNGVCSAPNTCDCNEGFVKDESNDNGTCFKSCKPECIHGFCSTHGCVCYFGWKGNSCDISLFCVVSESFPSVAFEVQSNSIIDSRDQNHTKEGTKNFRMDFDRPSCELQCLAEVNGTTLNFTKKSTNEIQYFLPVDSACNVAESQVALSKTYVNVMGTVVGIILFALVIYTVYIVKINRNHKDKINSGSRECVYTEEMDDSSMNHSSNENIQSL